MFFNKPFCFNRFRKAFAYWKIKVFVAARLKPFLRQWSVPKSSL